MFFYLLFGFSLFVEKLSQRFCFLVVLVVGLSSCGTVFDFENPIFRTYTNPIMLEFLAGVGLGYFREYLHGSSWKLGGALVILSVAMLLFFDADQSSRFWIYGVPSLMLVVGVVSLEKYIKLHINKLPLFFGEISYSLYLSHPISQRIWYVVFVLVFGQILNESLALRYFVGSVFVGVLGGMVCYYVLEKQFLRLGRLKAFFTSNESAVL
jgi:exopolysaccharide production protein ExoZ